VEAKPKSLKLYKTAGGREPFAEWMENHEHEKIWEITMARLQRVKAGNLGATRSVGEGVIELKIRFNQGYRVYVGIDGDQVILPELCL
jgi:putative addiction module killer protein